MAMKKRITVNDIAKAVGTSITTVSFILNGKAKERRISDAVNKRVLDYVKRMGYKPSQLVRNTPHGQVKVLALLVEDIHHPFFSAVGKHVERLAAASGYQIVHCNTNQEAHKISQFLKFCVDKEIDGVLMVPSEDLEETILRIKKQHVPTVFFDRFIPAVDSHYVVSDQRKGAYDATAHLLEMGSGRVGLVSLYANNTQMRMRQDGYMDAMDQFQQQSFIKKLNTDVPDDEIGMQITGFIAGNKLDAVLFADHYLAICALKAIKEQAVDMPRMVAFDDHPLFALHSPAISVVTQDTEQIAVELMRILMAEIDGKLKESHKVVLPCSLIVREPFIS